MKKRNINFLILVAIILTGSVLRLTNLPQKPMHNDEAVNAVKFGNLLEKGEYVYDKIEFHGPIIYYLTLIPAWLSNVQNFSQLNERHLRVVPAIAGIGLLLLLLWIGHITGWRAIFAGMLLGGLSPAMVFYSRYYIHETLLVFFTFGFIISLFGYFNYRKNRWLMLSAIFLGLMHTTKETFILSVVVLFVSFFLEQIFWRNSEISCFQVIKSLKWHQYLIFFGIASFISILFFSSVFKNPQGVIDSITTYESYFTKAGQNEVHQHPWYYYLKILAWNKGPGRLVWTELPVLIFSVVGIFFAFFKRGLTAGEQFFRIIAIFSILMMVLYSIMPYKTPWNILSSYFGMILLAGFGITQALNTFQKGWIHTTILIYVTVVSFYLIAQVIYTNYKYSAHPSNPYVYGHTSIDVFHMVARIKNVSDINPEGKDLYIHVICSEDDYWPLPWYLREFNHVGWWNKIYSDTPLVPLIVVSPDLKEPLIEKMYTQPKPGEKYLYVPLFDEGTELRPGVLLNAFVRQDYLSSQRSSE